MYLPGWLADDCPDRRTVGEIHRKVIKQTGRNAASRLFHAKNDKETIAAWRSELNRVLQVFTVRSMFPIRSPLNVLLQTELVVNTHTMVLDLHRDRNAGTGQEGTDDQRPVSTTLIHRQRDAYYFLDSAHVDHVECQCHRVLNLTSAEHPSRRATSPSTQGMFRA